jgi:hypothetical protein
MWIFDKFVKMWSEWNLLRTGSSDCSSCDDRKLWTCNIRNLIKCSTFCRVLSIAELFASRLTLCLIHLIRWVICFTFDFLSIPSHSLRYLLHVWLFVDSISFAELFASRLTFCRVHLISWIICFTLRCTQFLKMSHATDVSSPFELQVHFQAFSLNAVNSIRSWPDRNI